MKSRLAAKLFQNAFRWRASQNNSGPIVKQKRREWALCALLDFTATDNATSAEDIDPPQRPKIELSKPVAELWSKTVKEVGLFGKDKKNIAKLVKEAEKKEAAAKEVLRTNEEQSQKARSQIEEIKTCEAVKTQLQGQLKQAEDSLASAQAHQIGLGEKCDFTQKDICDLVNEQGCLVGKAGCDPKVVHREVHDLRRKIKDLEDEISKKERKISSLTNKVLGKQGGTLESVISEYRTRVKRNISAVQQKHALVETCRNLAFVITPDPDSGTTTDNGGHKRAANADNYVPTQENNYNFSEFCKTYQRVVRFLISPTARSEIQRSAGGIRIQVTLDGKECSGSNAGLMKLLALDFAVLVRSMEAPVFLPGLLIHDSPRQQDVTNDEYWRLFRLAHALEQKDRGEKLFQYVIISPSPPPEDLSDDHVVLKLGLSQQWNDALLFRSRF